MNSLKPIVLALFFACFIAVPQFSFAEDDTCDPEPTDMTVNYGDYIFCSLSPAEDSDTYRIWGNEGDRLFIDLVGLEGLSDPSFKLMDSNGTILFDSYGRIGFDEILTKTGKYTITVHSIFNKEGQYSLHIVCNGGACLPDPSYQLGYADGQATCDDGVMCTQVITYGKVPDTGCWVEFPTPCDVPDGWESTSEQPEGMCGVVATCNNEDTGITLSPELNMHVPMMRYNTLLGDLKLWGNFEFNPGENGELFWKLVDFGEIE